MNHCLSAKTFSKVALYTILFAFAKCEDLLSITLIAFVEKKMVFLTALPKYQPDDYKNYNGAQTATA
jgi:hypothetical protein